MPLYPDTKYRHPVIPEQLEAILREVFSLPEITSPTPTVTDNVGSVNRTMVNMTAANFVMDVP